MRALDDVLALHTLRFHDEVVAGDDLDIDAPGRKPVQARGRRWPTSSSTRCSEDFDPEDYEDSYRESVLDLIKRKAAGKEIDLAEQEEPEHGDDLMAALEASARRRKKGRELKARS